MMTITGLRDAITEEIEVCFDKADVESHAGRFDSSELKKFITRAPAIRVAVLSVEPESRAGDEDSWQVRLAAFVLTKDSAKAGEGRLSRDAAAMNMVTALLPVIRAGRYGAETGRAEKVSARNLHTDALQDAGATLWAVDWRQTLQLGKNAFVEDGTVPSEIYLGLAPEIGADHVDDYVLISSEAGDD